jgi:N-acetylmuramoyl-L-alanine amidase
MIPYIIIHHSLTKDGQTVSWSAIRKYHVNTLGYKDVGYHWGVELVNDEYEVILGRIPGTVGAHCIPRNKDSIGICVVGNFEEAAPPVKQWYKTLQLCKWLMKVYRIPVASVLGHMEAQENRECPGKYFDMDKFRSEL